MAAKMKPVSEGKPPTRLLGTGRRHKSVKETPQRKGPNRTFDAGPYVVHDDIASRVSYFVNLPGEAVRNGGVDSR